jgi:16S rRNA (guanine966-N2)-methyltransferase
MVKEAIFNILPPLSGKTFLDIFAGTGSVGLEALSRGASSVVFIEKDGSLSHSIKKSLLQYGFAGRHEILAMEAKKALLVLQKRNENFDVLFADPPYNRGMVKEILDCIAGGRLFAEDGMLIMQHSAQEELRGDHIGDLILTDQRRYGGTILSFLKLTVS